jgi:hypothetical protein
MAGAACNDNSDVQGQGLGANLGHHAKVEDADAAVGCAQQIARVWVRVQQPSLQQLQGRMKQTLKAR